MEAQWDIPAEDFIGLVRRRLRSRHPGGQRSVILSSDDRNQNPLEVRLDESRRFADVAQIIDGDV